MAISLCNSVTDEHNRELTRHGTALFPIAAYHDNLQIEIVPWHWHDELELFSVETGTAVVHIESEEFILKKGEGMFINAGVLHEAHNLNDAPCRLHSLVFHPRLVSGGIDSIFWTKYAEPVITNPSYKYLLLNQNIDWESKILNELENCYDAIKNENFGYEFQVRDSLSKILLSLFYYKPAAEKLPTQGQVRQDERLKTMLSFIHSHYEKSLTVHDIASAAMISESECLRCFRKTIGKPPIQYLKHYRLQRATDMLIHSNEKITDIALLCGLTDSSYFIKLFHEENGCTPVQFREAHAIFTSTVI